MQFACRGFQIVEVTGFEHSKQRNRKHQLYPNEEI